MGPLLVGSVVLCLGLLRRAPWPARVLGEEAERDRRCADRRQRAKERAALLARLLSPEPGESLCPEAAARLARLLSGDRGLFTVCCEGVPLSAAGQGEAGAALELHLYGLLLPLCGDSPEGRAAALSAVGEVLALLSAEGGEDGEEAPY